MNFPIKIKMQPSTVQGDDGQSFEMPVWGEPALMEATILDGQNVQKITVLNVAVSTPNPKETAFVGLNLITDATTPWRLYPGIPFGKAVLLHTPFDVLHKLAAQSGQAIPDEDVDSLMAPLLWRARMGEVIIAGLKVPIVAAPRWTALDGFILHHWRLKPGSDEAVPGSKATGHYEQLRVFGRVEWRRIAAAGGSLASLVTDVFEPAQAVGPPRRRFSMERLTRWYEARVLTWPVGTNPPSEAEDLAAARQKEFPDIPRDPVRDVRAQIAPEEWKRRGRRPLKLIPRV